MELKTYLADKKKLVEDYLERYFQENPFAPSILHDAMKYSLFAGGKRIRPILCITAHEACGGAGEDILPQAAAFEMIHTYSLIHDDLPAMDDDDLRRGKPTSHKVYGEAIAILAGDGLLTEAFRMFSESRTIPSASLLNALRELSASAGLWGMVAGQAADIISEGKEAHRETLEFIHKNKTGALLRASVAVGAILRDAAGAEMEALTQYGQNIGLAFQVVDDILDITQTTQELGKPQGSDSAGNKMTYPALYGLERSREIAGQYILNALEALKPLGPRGVWLGAIAEYLRERTN
jgi:geranylgeranyl diphosphate synthase type II